MIYGDLYLFFVVYYHCVDSLIPVWRSLAMDNHTWERGEEKIQNGLPTMARDAETGECWLQQQPSVTEELGDKPSGFPIFAKCTKHYTTIKAWKIPKEYSNLGSSSKSLSTSNLSLTVYGNNLPYFMKMLSYYFFIRLVIKQAKKHSAQPGPLKQKWHQILLPSLPIFLV